MFAIDIRRTPHFPWASQIASKGRNAAKILENGHNTNCLSNRCWRVGAIAYGKPQHVDNELLSDPLTAALVGSCSAAGRSEA
jgi:hypothetical protein